MDNERIRKAFHATRALGIPDGEVKPVLKQLLKVFDQNWELIEGEDYRALIDSYFELKEKKQIGEKEVAVTKHDEFERPSKKLNTGKQEDNTSFTVGESRSKLAIDDIRGGAVDSFKSGARETKVEPDSLVLHKKFKDKGKNLIPSHMSLRERKPISKTTSVAVNVKQPPDEPCSSNGRREISPGSIHKVELRRPKIDQPTNGLGHPSKPIARNKTKKPVSDLNKNSICSENSNSSNQLNGSQPFTHEPKVRRISDITKRRENVQISLVDETGKEDRPEFTYISHNITYQNAYVHISLARISDEDCCSSCKTDCLQSPVPCACARETGGEFAYTQSGVLKEEFLEACISMKREPDTHPCFYCQDCPLERYKNEYRPEKCKGHLVRKFVKECWMKCGCTMRCGNRVVQRGITCNVQVFITREGKGWGLRTLQDLPKGTFVCEYVGEILTNTELYERNLQSTGNERHTYPVTLDADWGSEQVLKDEEALCLDATYCGNVARFINHRCNDANLIDIPVEVETPDRHYYHLAFFTTREIHSFEELTWDYGIDFSDHDHPIQAFKCSCGSELCRDRPQKSK